MVLQLAANTKLIRDEREALHALQGDTEIALDLETSGLSPYRDKVAVVSMYGDDGNALAVLHVRGRVSPELKKFLEEPHRRFTMHNGVSFDAPFLMAAGVDLDKAKLYDTLTGATIVATGTRQNERVNLKAEVDRRLGITLSKDSGGHGHWMDPELTQQQLDYCAEDIVSLHALRRAQEAEAQRTGQLQHLKLEGEITGIVSRMTHNGLPIDLDALDGYLAEQAVVQEELYKDLTTRHGHINYGSHVQVKALFRRLGLTLPTTEADFLEELAFDGPEALLENRTYMSKEGKTLEVKFTKAVEEMGLGEGLDIDTLIKFHRIDQQQAEQAISELELVVKLRQAKKAQDSYGPKFVDRFVTEGIVHSRFWQAGADTNRFTSSDPNLQQVPKAMRWVFGHRPGWSIVNVDYSQIEVVVAAYLANDQVLLNLIEQGGDIHRLVASQLFGIDPEMVTDKQRRLSKACSFTLIFGGGAPRLVSQARQYGARINLEEGKELSQLFFKRFKGLHKDRVMAYDLARRGQRILEVRLASGFRRLLVGAKVKPTTLLNTRVQGTAAIGLKAALRLAHQQGLGMYLGAPVHDELVACVPNQWAEEYKLALEAVMIKGMQTFVPVTVRVEGKVGEAWS